MYWFCAVEVKLLPTTQNTIALTWSGAGSVSLNDFDIEISWQKNSSDLCQHEDTKSTIIDIDDLVSNVTIDGLEEYSNYVITVHIGSLISNSTTAMTKESGMLILIVRAHLWLLNVTIIFPSSSICCSS